MDVFKNFTSFTKKTHVLESLFNKVFNNIFFAEHPPVATSVVFAVKQLNIQCYNNNFGL